MQPLSDDTIILITIRMIHREGARFFPDWVTYIDETKLLQLLRNSFALMPPSHYEIFIEHFQLARPLDQLALARNTTPHILSAHLSFAIYLVRTYFVKHKPPE